MKNIKKILFVIVPILTVILFVVAIMIFGSGNKGSETEKQDTAPVVVYSFPEEEGIDANAPTDYYITENGMMIEQNGVLVPYEVDRDEFFAFLSPTPTQFDQPE